jgi:hypothetical protein
MTPMNNGASTIIPVSSGSIFLFCFPIFYFFFPLVGCASPRCVDDDERRVKRLLIPGTLREFVSRIERHRSIFFCFFPPPPLSGLFGCLVVWLVVCHHLRRGYNTMGRRESMPPGEKEREKQTSFDKFLFLLFSPPQSVMECKGQNCLCVSR